MASSFGVESGVKFSGEQIESSVMSPRICRRRVFSQKGELFRGRERAMKEDIGDEGGVRFGFGFGSMFSFPGDDSNLKRERSRLRW